MKKVNFFSSLLSLLILSGCAHSYLNLSSNGYTRSKKQKTNINEYSYLETSTGIYNSSKAAQYQLSKKETAAAVRKLNAAQGIGYNESTEEKIEKQAAEFISQGRWKSAFDTLMKYEPVLTHNKNLTNQIIYVSLKLDYYDFAIDQIKLALNQKDEMRALNETRYDKEVILAHVYYLSEKYDQAVALYTKLLEQDNYTEAAKYLFLIGYKLKDVEMMKNYLAFMGEAHPQFVEYSVLTAKIEIDRGQIESARERLAAQFENHSDNQDVVFEYAAALIEAQQYPEAMEVLDHNKAYISDSRQYNFIKSYIYFQSGDKKQFQHYLNATSVESKYKKSLVDLFLQKKNYSDVYAKIFQETELDQYKFTQLVKQDAEKFTYNYINKPQFKDSILVREEYRSVTEPIRLPASLEFTPAQ